MAGFIERHDARLIIVPDWKDFVDWVEDCGYDESCLDINDSICHALQTLYLEEVECSDK